MSDGSVPSTTGVSINDILYTGPKLQEDLFDVLLRYRSYHHVLTCDVEKVCQQFLVRSEDRKYQQILCRNSNREVGTYQPNTVTFGLSAIRCLKQSADDEGHRFPRAPSVLQGDFYVDGALYQSCYEGRSTIA